MLTRKGGQRALWGKGEGLRLEPGAAYLGVYSRQSSCAHTAKFCAFVPALSVLRSRGLTWTGPTSSCISESTRALSLALVGGVRGYGNPRLAGG